MASERVEQSSFSWRHGHLDEIRRAPKDLLDTIHFHYPWVLFLIFLIIFITTSVMSLEPSTESNEPVLFGPGGKPLPRSARKVKEEREKRKKLQDFSPGRKVLFLYLGAGLLSTFLANGVIIVIHALTMTNEGGWWCGPEMSMYVCGSAFFYSVLLISLVDTAPSPSITHEITWTISLVWEIVLLGASFKLYTSPHADTNSLQTTSDKRPKISESPNKWEVAELVADVVRVAILLCTVGFYLLFAAERAYKMRSANRLNYDDFDESAPLLINGHANGISRVNSNGAITNGGTGPPSENGNIRGRSVDGSLNGHVANKSGGGDKISDDNPAFYKPTTVPNRTWWEYIKGYSLFFPYLWPSRSLKLQGVVILCFCLVILQRIVNMKVPLQMGKVTDQLGGTKGQASDMPWASISFLIFLRFLQGTSGILGAVRSILWVPISQYSYQALTTASFEHVHSLSLDFHLGKRTGEVLSALSKGNAINNFLEQITFQVVPMVIDLGVAIVVFGVKFGSDYALIVSVITFSYLYLTIRMARWRSDQRRQMTTLSREEDAVKNDSLTSYETVKYFNAEEYEFRRYRLAVVNFQQMEYKVTISLNILNISQNLVFMTGLLMTSFISAYQVTKKERKVGEFVMLISYMAQLQQPLNFFGSFYRSVQSAMISGERLLELFKEQPTVIDEPSARSMPACEGEIRFEDVKFSYDTRKPALESLSFTCKPGTTTAFVGESGGGKSTVFRLVYRYYNAQNGSIQVDGNDIKDITIDSLRRHIGVVPQDTILFNETLMYNLKYANQSATDEQVFDACRAASIHEKILGFPDGYNTKVGERGLRLSGGEKQRVAIARTILKDPRIILLDEATAALDSATEENIQEALRTLSQGRTMLVIAHRLSTITSAEQILVLHAGRVAEAGTHQELLAMKGRYATMWRKQIKANRAMEQASIMVAKAKALTEAVMNRPGSSGNEDGPSEDVSENEADNGRLATSKSTLRDAESVKDGASSITHVDDIFTESKVEQSQVHGTTDDGKSESSEIAEGMEGSQSDPKDKDDKPSLI